MKQIKTPSKARKSPSRGFSNKNSKVIRLKAKKGLKRLSWPHRGILWLKMCVFCRRIKKA